MRRIILISLGVIFLVSCAQAVNPATMTPSETPLAPTNTILPTDTRLPTRTFFPTKTPTKAVTPSATITPPSVQPVPLSPLALNEFNAGTEMTRLAVYGTGEPTDMAWSPDGKTFAIATKRGVWLYDGETIEEIGFIDVNDEVAAMAFSPDGQILALGVRGQVGLWSVTSKQKIKNITSDLKTLFSLAYGKGGQIAAFGALTWTDYGDYMLKLWDGNSGREIFSKQITYKYTEPVFSPDGSILAYLDNSDVKLIDSKTAALISESDFSSDLPVYLRFTPDGTRLIINGASTHNVWDFANDTKGYFDACYPTIAWTDQYLLCDEDASSYIINLSTGEKAQEINFSVNHIQTVLRPDGRFLADLNRRSTIEIVRTTDSAIHKTLPFTSFSGEQIDQRVGLGIVVIENKSINIIATVNLDGNIDLWNALDGEIVLTVNSNSSLTGLAFSPDKFSLASVDEEHVLKLWNIKSNSFIVLGEKNIEGPIGFSPDGRKLIFYQMPTKTELAYGVTRKKTLFDFLSSKVESMGPPLIRNPFEEKYLFLPNGNLLDLNFQDEQYSLVNTAFHENILLLPDIKKSKRDGNNVSEIDSMAISSDGILFAYAKYDGTIDIWDLPSKKLLKSFQGHPSIQTPIDIWSTRRLTFSPKSNLLLSVGADGTTRLWNARTGTELRRLNVCCYADFTPDGRYLVTAGAGVIRVWGLPEP